MLNKIKVGLANIALNFISVPEKLSYMFLESSARNIKPIAILPAVNTTMKLLLNKIENKRIHGLICNGTINGVEVSIIQTNMGSPNTAVIMETLKNAGCKAVIRIDFCGGLKTTKKDNKDVLTGVDIGEIVIPKRVFLSDGTSLLYLQQYRNEISSNPLIHTFPVINPNDKTNTNKFFQYPNLDGNYYSADCDTNLYEIIKKYYCEQYKTRDIEDIIWSSDSLFCEGPEAVNTWKHYGCNSVDMESCAVYLLGALYKIPVISILGVSDLPDCEEYDLFKVNKIHPGILTALKDAYKIMYNSLPAVKQRFVKN